MELAGGADKLTQLALRYSLDHPAVAVAIPGSSYPPMLPRMPMILTFQHWNGDRLAFTASRILEKGSVTTVALEDWINRFTKLEGPEPGSGPQDLFTHSFRKISIVGWTEVLRGGVKMNIAEEIIISPLMDELIDDINKTNDYFKVFGKVVPSFQSGKWSFEESLFDETKEIRFPDDKLDWSLYINREDKALFLAYKNNNCIGQIRIIKDWHRFCYIENIATKKEYRGYGIGKLLLTKAEEWAKQRKLIGMSLETQDDNLGACRFYVKQGFVLGGVDTLKESYNPNIETTLYWYKLFT